MRTVVGIRLRVAGRRGSNGEGPELGWVELGEGWPQAL